MTLSEIEEDNALNDEINEFRMAWWISVVEHLTV